MAILSPRFMQNFALERRGAHLSAMAEAQTSLHSTLCLLGGPLFVFFGGASLSDGKTEVAIISSLFAIFTGASLLAAHQWLRKHPEMTLPGLERLIFFLETLVYLAVLAYVLVNFHPAKMLYLILMPIVFSMAGVTVRLTTASVAICLATLAFVGQTFPALAHTEHSRVVAATTVISIAIGLTLRRTLIRQVRSRVQARSSAQELERQAGLDPLTGLDNRRVVFKRLEKLVETGQRVWLGLLELHGLKTINDVHGQKAGDDVLIGIAARLASICIPGLTIGRLGGDEFALIFTGDRQCEDVARLCRQILAIVPQQEKTERGGATMSGSIGLVSFPDMAASLDELYEKADFALHKAKSRGRGEVVLFDAREAGEFRANIELEAQLAEADLDAELFLVFQPQVDLSSDRPKGFEALVRWNSPKLGFVPPDRFIRSAERIGLIQDITRVVLRKGLAVLATWPEEVCMSFNISAENVSDAPFLAELLDIVNDAGVSPSRVEFEITETAILSDPSAAQKALAVLAEAGCGIALDDFGIGYSSLQHLRTLPLHKVKIDRSFVRDASVARQSLEIIAAVIGLCRRLGLNCVLEGVETDAELSLLAPLGADCIQGYLFGRPMDAENALSFIMSRRAEPSAQ